MKKLFIVCIILLSGCSTHRFKEGTIVKVIMTDQEAMIIRKTGTHMYQIRRGDTFTYGFDEVYDCEVEPLKEKE